MNCFENKYCKITTTEEGAFNVKYKVVYEKWFGTLNEIPKEKIVNCQLLEVNKNLHFQWFIVFPVWILLFIVLGLLVGETRQYFESEMWWPWYEGIMTLLIVFWIFVFWAYVIADGLMQKYFIGKYFDITLGKMLRRKQYWFQINVKGEAQSSIIRLVKREDELKLMNFLGLNSTNS